MPWGSTALSPVFARTPALIIVFAPMLALVLFHFFLADTSAPSTNSVVPTRPRTAPIRSFSHKRQHVGPHLILFGRSDPSAQSPNAHSLANANTSALIPVVSAHSPNAHCADLSASVLGFRCLGEGSSFSCACTTRSGGLYHENCCSLYFLIFIVKNTVP